jgi:hypothetical protein
MHGHPSQLGKALPRRTTRPGCYDNRKIMSRPPDSISSTKKPEGVGKGFHAAAFTHHDRSGPAFQDVPTLDTHRASMLHRLNASDSRASVRKPGPKCRCWSRRSAEEFQARYPRDMFATSPNHTEAWAFRISGRKPLAIQCGSDRQDNVRQTPQPSRLFSLIGEISNPYSTAKILEIRKDE